MLEAGDLAVAAIEHAGQGDQRRCDQRGGRHKRPPRRRTATANATRVIWLGVILGAAREHERGDDPLGYGAVQFRRDGAVEGLARVREEERRPGGGRLACRHRTTIHRRPRERTCASPLSAIICTAPASVVSPLADARSNAWTSEGPQTKSADIEGIVVVQVFVDELNLVASEADLHGVRGVDTHGLAQRTGQQPRRLGRARALTCGGVP